jgi:signal peptidase I
MRYNRAINVISWILIAFVVVWLFITYFMNQPIFVSYTLTNSMEPVINIGDLFFLEPYHTSIDSLVSLNVGDIIVFKSANGNYLVHRIIGDTVNGFVTKGDNSPFSDQQGIESLVQKESIVGKVLMFQGNPLLIPKAGLLIRQFSLFFQRNTFLVAGLVGSAGTILLYLDKKSTRSFHRRKTLKNRKFDMKKIYVVCFLLLSVVVLVPMITGVVAHDFEYVVTDGLTNSNRAVTKGTLVNRSLELSNNGILPVYVFLSTNDPSVQIESEAFLLYPGSTEVEIKIQAENEIGYYEKAVNINKYLPVLPLTTVGALLELNPCLPIFIISLMVLSPFVVAYFLLPKRSFSTYNLGFKSIFKRLKSWS